MDCWDRASRILQTQQEPSRWSLSSSRDRPSEYESWSAHAAFGRQTFHIRLRGPNPPSSRGIEPFHKAISNFADPVPPLVPGVAFHPRTASARKAAVRVAGTEEEIWNS